MPVASLLLTKGTPPPHPRFLARTLPILERKGGGDMAKYACDKCGTTSSAATRCCGAPMAKVAPKKGKKAGKAKK